MRQETPAQRIEARSSERRALKSLHELCRTETEVAELLWAMVASLKQAKEGMH